MMVLEFGGWTGVGTGVLGNGPEFGQKSGPKSGTDDTGVWLEMAHWYRSFANGPGGVAGQMDGLPWIMGPNGLKMIQWRVENG